MGDGDCVAIGGNHLIHAARRNIDLTAIVFNNSIYGMTGGQMSPTTFEGDLSTTSPYGNIEQAFDICELARAAGATYVARGTSWAYPQLVGLIAGGIVHKGFSFIEAMAACPTYYGRQNHGADPAEMLRRQRDRSVPVATYRARASPPPRPLPRRRAAPRRARGVHRGLRGGAAACPLLTQRGRGQRGATAAAATRSASRAPADRASSSPPRCSPTPLIASGKEVLQTQSYGPEARGGASKAEIIVSDTEIDFPEVTAPDVTLCLSQEAFDSYAAETKPGGVVLYDQGAGRSPAARRACASSACPSATLPSRSSARSWWPTRSPWARCLR